MQNMMNMKNKTHKCVPRNNQIKLSTQEYEWVTVICIYNNGI